MLRTLGIGLLLALGVHYLYLHLAVRHQLQQIRSAGHPASAAELDVWHVYPPWRQPS